MFVIHCIRHNQYIVRRTCYKHILLDPQPRIKLTLEQISSYLTLRLLSELYKKEFIYFFSIYWLHSQMHKKKKIVGHLFLVFRFKSSELLQSRGFCDQIKCDSRVTY